MGFQQFLIYLLHRLFLPGALRTMEWQMLRLVNKERRSVRLRPLKMQSDLRRVARKHSRDMARRNYFEHVNLQGQSPADRLEDARVSDVISGENLAKIHGYKFPLHRAHVGLMNSPGHRKNILHSSYNCVGIGVVKSSHGTYYYTQNFAYRSLIFRRNIPEKIRRGKDFVLRFEAMNNEKYGVYRILENKQIIREHSFRIEGGVNQLKLPFSQKGQFTVQLYTGMGRKLKLANSFELSVKGAWFE